jgi:tryptophan synthase alpha chain
MSRLSSAFEQGKRRALIAYITIGYPDMQSTLDASELLADEGCDIIELGIPFSDPLADGVTIQKATHQALLNGVTTRKCLETAARISSRVKVPLCFMGYLNPIINYGVEDFCAESAKAGVDGLIIPDLPPGEMADLDVQAQRQGLDLVRFLAPNSSVERIKEVAGIANGFIYLVSVTGITGVREGLSGDLENFVSRVRKATGLPLCIGFGISNAEQAAQAAQLADGVIIGSRIIQLMEENGSYSKLRDFIAGVRQALDGV